MVLRQFQTAFAANVHLGVIVAMTIALTNCSQTTIQQNRSRVAVEPGQITAAGSYRVGNPYVVNGRTYVPHEDPHYRAEGKASWYGADFHGRLTANGEVYDADALSAAHPTLPLPCYVRVTNLENHRSLVIRVNDRGPYRSNRLIDVSAQAAKLLGFYDKGLTDVRVEFIKGASLNGPSRK